MWAGRHPAREQRARRCRDRSEVSAIAVGYLKRTVAHERRRAGGWTALLGEVDELPVDDGGEGTRSAAAALGGECEMELSDASGGKRRALVVISDGLARGAGAIR